MTPRSFKALRPIVTAAWASVGLLVLAGPAIAQDSDRYAFTQEYDPSPALWELSDEDTTIYMLGTIHLLPEGFRWRNPQLDAIIEEVDTLVVETSDADAEGAMEPMAEKIANMLESRTPTSRQLSPASQSAWRELVGQTGMPFEYVDSLPVMVALMGFGQTGFGTDPSSYEYGVETILEREFAKTRRPVESIESVAHVTYSLFREDEAAILRELDLELRKWSGKSVSLLNDEADEDLRGDDYWAMEHAWARGEVGDDFDLGFGDGKIAETFRSVLLDRRNRRWAGWLEERLEQPGTLLLAVGAGHFEGSDSVLARLEQRGLRARRIN